MTDWAVVFAVLLIPMAVFVFAALGMRALGLLERIANALEFIAKTLTREPERFHASGDVPSDVREAVAYAFRSLAEELER